MGSPSIRGNTLPVGARVVEMGGVGLYGRPRPLPLAHTLGEHDHPTRGRP